MAPGLHTLTVEVEDHVGNRATTQGDVAVIPPAHIAFVEPAENATVTDAVPLTLAVNSVEGEKELLLKADNREVGRIMGSPYTFAWNLRRETEGSHALEASLTTEAGYVATAERTIRVGPHVVVRIEQPIAGADLAGNVNILADVTSDAPVAEVIFKVAGREVGKATSGAYRASYHTGDFPPGEYTVQVEARNTEGMTGLAEVPVRMTPTSRTSAMMVALAGGLLLLLVVPVALLARPPPRSVSGSLRDRARRSGRWRSRRFPSPGWSGLAARHRKRAIRSTPGRIASAATVTLQTSGCLILRSRDARRSSMRTLAAS